MKSSGNRPAYFFAVHTIGNFIAIILVAAVLHPHVTLPPTGTLDYWVTAILFASVLSFLNHYIRPLIYLLLAPLTCLLMLFTLGLGHFLTGALMFWLAGEFIDTIYVESFGFALLGALVTALIGQVIASFVIARISSNPPPPQI
jgi:putative membrane protein